MIQTFQLVRGEISFEENKIIIKDNSRRQSYFELIGTAMGATFFAILLVRDFKTDSAYDSGFLFFLGLINLSVFIIMLLRSTQGEIQIREIKSVNIEQRFANKFIDIKLKNNRLRRVAGVKNKEELEAYIERYVKPKIGRPGGRQQRLF
jgi:hypothetical protein